MREGKELSKEDREKEIHQMKDRIALLEHDPPGVDKAYAVSEGKPADAQLRPKGDPYKKGEKVPRGFLQILGGQTLPADEKGSGRRELASWLTSNPLMARVMVNRIWQDHFGQGHCRDIQRFRRARRPSRQSRAPLDWLASRFRESGYSIKAMAPPPS